MSARLRVNPITCKAHGLCAELLPELIDLDDWGYPILRSSNVPNDLEAHARRAVAVCPVLALHLRRISSAAGSPAADHARAASSRGSAVIVPRI
jgi:ferredoxin